MRAMARHLGFSHGSGYQYWEQGAGSERNYMAPDLAIKMMSLIGIGNPPITREDIESLFPSIRPQSNVRAIPVISWVAAGSLAIAEEPWGIEGERKISVCDVPDTTFALDVSGNSMNRVASDGSTIVVDYADRELVAGRYYVIKVGDDATFKRFRDNPARFEPESTEPHDTIFVTSDVDLSVVGRVVQVVTAL